ncbi:MAG: GNAT family N-acetyltransferase [Clostridiales bacterium]|nr:GNAT family N-acetyltransferase [Clostridiales bacterium]
MRQLSGHHFTKKQFTSCYEYNLDRNHILVWEQNRRVCGCGILNIHYYLHFSLKSAEVVNLVVDENARGRGIGKELLTALEQIAIDNGCGWIELGSGKHRKDAHRFYEREGFVQTHYKLTKEL